MSDPGSDQQTATASDQTGPAGNKGQTLFSHLSELRDRLMRMMLVILVLFLALFAFSEQIFTWFAGPMLELMPEGTSMIATSVTAPFLVPFKLVLMVSLLVAVPYILHQIWGFIAPGLYSHEKRMAMPLLVSSVCLFYLGIAFAYYVVFPLLFGFFIAIAPQGVAVMTDIGQYLDFIIAIFFAFGIAFEVPVATFLMVLAGVTTPDKLAAKRSYIIVAAFVIGMFLTPPDIISQTLLALPIWLLFESGLFMSRVVLKDVLAERERNADYEILEEGDMDDEMDRMEEEEAENLKRGDQGGSD